MNSITIAKTRPLQNPEPQKPFSRMHCDAQQQQTSPSMPLSAQNSRLKKIILQYLFQSYVLLPVLLMLISHI